MSLIKHKLPCPKCGGSDPVSLDEKGAGYCFSCDTYFKNYMEEVEGSPTKNEPIDIKPYRNNAMNNSEGEFLALTDRGISLGAAKTFGVKAVKDYNGKIVKHLYQYYIANEIVG